MKILELCPFSAGGCGVWARVKRESALLVKKRHEVMVFSSDFEKGTNKRTPLTDKVDGFSIQRFPAKKLGGESYMQWNFRKEAINFRPDIIIAHAYRHTHTIKALEVAKRLGCKVFLVTHAPFERKRQIIDELAVFFYDLFIGRRTINQFNKVLAISRWEYPYLQTLGLDEKNIIYSPNGILDEFFAIKAKSKEEKERILYTGRIASIKNLEAPIVALALVKNKSLKLEIIGPAEQRYKEKLMKMINELDLGERVRINDRKYNTSEQIKELDSASMFILPSYSEGMPQSLVEAMAREKIVIASDIPASRELIVNGKNGFLFRLNDKKSLSSVLDKISLIPEKEKDKIRKEARKSVERFSWDKIISELDELINQ